MKVKCTQRYGCEWTGMCRHMQRVRWQRDRRLTPSRIVRNNVAQWEHVFIPLWSPYITHLGKWIGLTLHVTVFTLPSIHKWQRERKYSRDFIFWSGVWIVRGIWRMKLSLLAGLFEMDRFSLMSLSIQSFEKCISKGLHKIFCMFLSAINLNVKGYFKCSLESHWSTGKKKCSFIFTGNSF